MSVGDPPRVISVGVQTWGIAQNDGLLDAALVGTPDVVAARIAQYAEAGATDLMLGFADFPGSRMVGVFGERVLPALASR